MLSYYLIIISYILAQTGVITGTVRDLNTQELLIGVTIQLTGTKLGTFSNEN